MSRSSLFFFPDSDAALQRSDEGEGRVEELGEFSLVLA